MTQPFDPSTSASDVFRDVTEALAWAAQSGDPVWMNVTEEEHRRAMAFAQKMGLIYGPQTDEIRLLPAGDDNDPHRVPGITMSGFLGLATRARRYRPGKISFESTPFGFLCLATCLVRDADKGDWYEVTDHARLEDLVDRDLFSPWSPQPNLTGSRWDATPTRLLQERAEYFAARRGLPDLARAFAMYLPYKSVPSMAHWEQSVRDAAEAALPNGKAGAAAERP